jgi:CBS domain-containing protein
MPIEAPVRTITHFDETSLAPDDFIYSVLILMTKSNKRRIAIHDGATYFGILKDIVLLGFLPAMRSWWPAVSIAPPACPN